MQSKVEGSISMLIKFDAIMTGAVDNLKTVIRSSQHGNSLLDDDGEAAELKASSGKANNAKKSLQKGGS